MDMNERDKGKFMEFLSQIKIKRLKKLYLFANYIQTGSVDQIVKMI